MEKIGGSDGIEGNTGRGVENAPCAFRGDDDGETSAEKFIGQFPDSFDPNSPKEEEMMGRSVCAHPDCTLNFRLLSQFSSGITPSLELLEEVSWSVPPDCGLNNAAGIDSEL